MSSSGRTSFPPSSMMTLAPPSHSSLAIKPPAARKTPQYRHQIPAFDLPRIIPPADKPYLSSLRHPPWLSHGSPISVKNHEYVNPKTTTQPLWDRLLPAARALWRVGTFHTPPGTAPKARDDDRPVRGSNKRWTDLSRVEPRFRVAFSLPHSSAVVLPEDRGLNKSKG